MKNTIRFFALVVVAAGVVAGHASVANGTVTASRQASVGAPVPTCNPFTQCTLLR